MSSNISFSIEGLKKFIQGKGLFVKSIYTKDGFADIIHVISKLGENCLVTVPSKYPISSEGIEIIEYRLDDGYVPAMRASSEKYQELNVKLLKSLREDSQFISPEDKELIFQYKDINSEEKDNIISHNIYTYQRQLSRMKPSTINLKYKIGILSNSIISFITRSNNLETCLILKRPCRYEEERELIVVVDLENFYEYIHEVDNDISNLYKNFYSSMIELQNIYFNNVEIKLTKLQQETLKAKNKSRKRKEYEKSIKRSEELLQKIARREASILKEKNRANKTHDLDNDYQKLSAQKDEIINLLISIKSEYSKFLLDFDSSLSDNNELLQQAILNLSVG